MALGVGEAVDEAQFVILVMCTVAQGVGGADKLALAVVVVAPTGTGGVDKLLYLPLWRMAPLVTLPGRIGIQLQLALAIALEALQATARQWVWVRWPCSSYSKRVMAPLDFFNLEPGAQRY